MGKYMKKGKVTSAVMELPQSSSAAAHGVRTRARTLAAAAQLRPDSDLSCLQLRNRRLEKPPLTKPKARPDPETRRSAAAVEEGRFGHFDEVGWGGSGGDQEDQMEASFGENDLDFDAARERSTRESTPCSLIRNPEAIQTPSSANRPTYSTSANRRVQNALRGTIPTTPEMEEFFAGFELHQRKLFMDKYNYDIMNDLPLPGRYEWAIQVDN